MRLATILLEILRRAAFSRIEMFQPVVIDQRLEDHISEMLRLFSIFALVAVVGSITNGASFN